jgi:hypothetical protein
VIEAHAHPLHPSLPDSQVIRTWGGWLGAEVQRAEGSSVIYSVTVPSEEIKSGFLLALSDFHQGAEVAKSTQAVGTRVHKEAIARLAENEPPFNIAPRTKPEGLKAHGICTNYGYSQVWLNHFYIRTQALHDLNTRLEAGSVSDYFGQVGRRVIRAVLFDEVG